MKKTIILLLVSVLAVVFGSVAVLGAVPNGTTYTFVADDVTFTSDAPDTISAEGGNITNISASVRQQSSYWHAFYGDIVKQIFLADSGASNLVYDWGSQALNGWIFFSNESSVDWSGVAAATNADLAAENVELSLGNDAENITNTLALQTHNAIADIGAGPIPADTSFNVNTTSQTAGVEWSTVFLTGGTAAIYGGEVVQDQLSYSGNTVDFQVMVPVASTGSRTYNIYAGIE